MYVGHRLLRTQFLPLFCSGVGWKAGITFGRLMKFSRCGLRLQAQRSNESPSGAFKRQRGLRQQMEGRCPDKRYPNKITSEMQAHCRSEIPVEHNIFKN